jgi:seryl-tRNA synthetase
VEILRKERNEIAATMQTVAAEERPALIERGKELKQLIAVKEADLLDIEEPWARHLASIPNNTHPDAPVGADDSENVEVRVNGTPRDIASPLDHVALAERHKLIDFERGVKVAGAKFYFLRGKLAILEQALIRYGIDFALKEGFDMLTTPDLAKEDILVAKGFLPRGPEKQVYYVEGENLALVGTSEIPVLGFHKDETLSEQELPKKYVAFSHCFRTEAGAYGRESYGLYRVHQFSKVELFAFSLPEQSASLHQQFLRLEEDFWQSLGIPFRVVDCCTGDLGGSDYRRYDLEAWMYGKGDKGGWGEVTSTSDCGDYQSRGLGIQYLSAEGKRGYVHTLNGTVVATPRAMIAIMENGQQDDGSILIPKVLVPYCGFERLV